MDRTHARTGDDWLLEFAIKTHRRTQPEMNQWLDNHTVHFAQPFRYPAQLYPMTGDRRFIEKSKLLYDGFMATWGQMPRGAHAADEHIRMGKIDPGQAIETCTLSELNKSHYIMGRITGETLYADRVEDITFNHLPASHAPDHKSLRYLTACNMPQSVPKMDFHNGGNHPVFAADAHRCCQHNTAMGWPRFTRNLWQATPDNGLAAWIYAPCEVEAKVGEGAVARIVCETTYPFGDTVTLRFENERPVAFPLYPRVPGWCDALSLDVAGKERSIEGQAGKLLRIAREWKSGDLVQLKFGMEVGATVWPRNGAVTIDRGPLSYSVRIKQKWETMPNSNAKWPRWKVTPLSPWNYGLRIDPRRAAEAIEVVERDTPLAEQPWSEPNAPIVLRVEAERIPEWQTRVRNTVDSVREGPVRSEAPAKVIELIPMGCAHLRIAVLPIISDRPDARRWEEIPNPDEFMLERLTQ